MKAKLIIPLILLFLLVPFFVLIFFVRDTPVKTMNDNFIWEFRSVDTVKYSRDVAGQMLAKPEYDDVINKQVSDIASLGASHIAIATPYDAKYVPFLERWVKSARKYKLKVWFRGNFSGWENWFGYERITREEHKKLLAEFIVNNPALFEDGDIFTSCPECENGGPGDPRLNGDPEGHKKFLIEEYKISLESFGKINKKVNSGFYSMNYDVAKLIMDRETTRALGNIVVIDHYIKDPLQVAQDAKAIAETSGGNVILGEFGAPIPDIHGEFTEEEQSKWIEDGLNASSKIPEIIGVNYWVNVGGSTRLWNDDGSKRKAADTIKKYFTATTPAN